MATTDREVGTVSATAGGSDLKRDERPRSSTTILGAGQRGECPELVPAALVLEPVEGSEPDAFRIVVAAATGEALLVLGPFSDEDVVALWRSLAASSGLPLVIGGAEGRGAMFPQIGRLQLGPLRMRRSRSVLSRRRPRFLVRRKGGRMPRRPLVYREREIACGGDAR